MRILPISNTKFTGLFTDKTKENGNHWRMEYSPYSWENGNTSKMAKKERFNVSDNRLPDNEEVFVEKYMFEASKDILGTTSYYLNRNTSEMRRTITEVPAMNLEDSLIVRNKKLKEFLKQKEEAKNKIQESMKSSRQELERTDKEFDAYSMDYEGSWPFRDRSKEENKDLMVRVKSSMREAGRKMYDSVKEYTAMTDSIASVKKIKSDAEKDIALLQMARETDNLIDVSRRDVEEPDNALVEALKDMDTAIKKTIALPHRIISVKKLLKWLVIK